jgi:uncharacterized protein (TIGR02594 family)
MTELTGQHRVAMAFEMAQRYVGTKEVGGTMDNPLIMAMLKLDADWVNHDEVPWCSAFANWIHWHVRLGRSKSLRARSWLEVGKGIPLDDATHGDIIVIKRGKGNQPGPEITDAPGHVGFYAGMFGEFIEILGGNQSDTVKISRYPRQRLLGVRRFF